MSRKDYRAIAEAVAALYDDDSCHAWTLDVVAAKLADVLAADNPRFDRERFLAACQPAGAF